MGRTKLFDRESVLKKAMPVFWARGFANTAVRDLEEATGVNKSGLYSEFKDKDEIFVESLRYYYATREGFDLLTRSPLGWANIEAFLKFAASTSTAQHRGCFGVSSMRELESLPAEAREIISKNWEQLRRLFEKNIAEEKTTLPPKAIAELVSTFFAGFCIEQCLKVSKSTVSSKIENFVASLRSL